MFYQEEFVKARMGRKDGKYLAIGDCDEISRYIGLDTIMCGYKNKSVLACLYSQATGDNVHEMGGGLSAIRGI